MVESGQSQIRSVHFGSRLHAALPVEVIEAGELLARVGAEGLAAPQRPSFHALLLMRSGRGSHAVDFTDISARSGRLVQIRPGQVQVWNTEVHLDATLVLARAATAASDPWFPGHAPYRDLSHQAAAHAEMLVDILRRQQVAFDGGRPTNRLMTAMFDGLLALFDQTSVEPSHTPLPEVYVAFRDAVERDLTQRRDVVDYASDLGYSARTITRACEQVTGHTAKRVLVDRLVLEAKRMLVHTDLPAATISSRLGFSEPTNFAKFFARHTNRSPSRFRQPER